MKKVLIVEDEDVLREYFKAVLVRLGLDVITADDGDTAIEEFKKHPDTELVVLDLRMPRMSGKDALKILKGMKPDLKVLVSSAYVDDEDEILRMGANAVLKKPFPILSFKSSVSELLDLPERD